MRAKFEGLEARAHNVRVVDKVRYNPNHPILTISSSYMTELMDALPQSINSSPNQLFHLTY